jgi:hypothetical protein
MTILIPKFDLKNGGTTPANAVNRPINEKLSDFVSVLDFGADSTGVGDSSTAISSAISTGKAVYFPAGTYLCNVLINNKTVLYGDGSLVSIIKPFSYASPAMIYTYAAMQNPIFKFWDYHSEVRNLGFFGTGTKASATGIGFSFGSAAPLTYTANAQFANNVNFYNCFFSNLYKGVQFPLGNIGTEFYSCGFQSNYYGIYTVNYKNGNMHAGCKYFYNGEISANVCGIYYNNSQSGGGAISFTDTIFETNSIAAYIYNQNSEIVPVSFTNVWFEANGAVNSYAAVTIDAWSGATLTTQTIASRTIIVDGEENIVNFTNSFFTDCYVKATKAQVTALNCRSENNTGNNGSASNVDEANSSIRLINPNWSGGGPARGYNITSTGIITDPSAEISSSASSASYRWFTTISRNSKIASYGPSLAKAITFVSAKSTSGTFSLTGSVVSDGIIYSSCNEFTRAAFANGEYTGLTSDAITTSAGWYVFTFDAKVTAGAPRFYVWDRGTSQFTIQMTCETQNKWYSFAAIAYSAGSQNLYLDVGGSNATCTWRLSAYQIHRFNSRDEAASFLASGAYTES